MTPRYHPSDATLLAYAAGTLGEGLSLVVATHLGLCPKCRLAVSQGEAIGGILLEELEPEALACQSRERVLARLPGPEQSPSDPTPLVIDDPLLPPPLGGYLGRPFATLQWRPLGPGLSQIELLPRNPRRSILRLLRVDPGRALPRHGHHGTELTLVLTGAFFDQLGHFERGDVAEVDIDIIHQPRVDSDTDCICLIATDAPLKWESAMGRIIQRFTGF